MNWYEHYRLIAHPKKQVRQKRLISVWAVFRPMTVTFGRIGGGFHTKNSTSANVSHGHCPFLMTKMRLNN